MKKFLVLALLAVALIATPAMAKEGPYVGIGLTYVNIGGDSWFDTVEPATGLELRLGYNFGSIALEGNLIGSTHNDTATGWSDGDFTAKSIDLRLSFSQTNDPTQVYFLAGFGAYSFDQAPAGKLEGIGYNLGVGFEHFFNELVALDVRGVYRFIEYDELDGVSFSPSLDGDTITLGVGLNLHF